jgi:streptogrisin D
MIRRLALLVLVAALPAPACSDDGSSFDQPSNNSRLAVTDPMTAVPADDRAAMLAQEPLVDAASKIRAAVENGDSAGFSDLRLQDGKVVVYWRGELGPSMSAVVAEANKLAPVEVRAASRTRAELRAAAAVVGAMLRGNPSGALHAVSIAPDGSGLVLGVRPRSAFNMSAMPVVGVAMQAREEEPLVLESRAVDSPAWFGAARIVNGDNGAGCSIGFGVRSTASSQRYVLTAGHCGRVGGRWLNGNSTLTVGTASAENVKHDLLLIPADAGGRIYDGPFNAEFTKPVAAWDWVHNGESLCFSGATSAVHCGAIVDKSFTTACGTDAYDRYECYDDLLSGHFANNAHITQAGDRGGPWFSIRSNGSVVAKGTHTGFAAGHFVFQDFGTATRDFKITVVNGI